MTDTAERIARLSPAKRALLALEMDSKRSAADGSREEPIAVIGLSCRFPGARSPEAFWSLLRDGVDAIGEVPPDRWDLAALYDPDPDAPGKMYTRWGGFLEEVDRFDAPFFGISPAEAANMDPQHRLLLEVAWEALENAGLSPDGLVGSATGVFVGISGNDYSNLLHQGGDHTRINAYLGTGTVLSAASGRLSYLLGLQGPSLTLDTACSSSLVALHLACQSLRRRESDLALAGGVNLILSPESTIYSCRIKVMAADGRCKSFDAAADGYVRGEGCGLVVLKRLPEALAAGDPILAVVRGSAVNQDGRSGGLTAPNGLAQQAVIRRALEDAGLSPAQINYVEAHGSATPLGDPIEAQALGSVMAPGRPAGVPLPIGSVKSNLGHLEAAAGIAGLVKVVLALRHRQIPPSLHLRTPNPHIPFDRLALRVQQELSPWPAGPARAGVSSFGFVGTNAHVVVEEAPAREPSGPSRPWQLLLLSARTPSALQAMTRDLAVHLNGHPDVGLADTAFTLQVGRKSFEHRRMVLCERAGDAVAALQSLDPQKVFTHAHDTGPRPVAFLLPGVGDHYPGMAAGLYESEPVFRELIDRCAERLEPLCGLDLRRVLFPEAAGAGGGAGLDLKAMLRGPAAGGALAETRLSQPAVFAVEYALACLLIEWGIRPQAMIGYSLGELVAACLAGVFSLEDALWLVAERARLIQELPPGAMLAVPLGEAEIRSRLDGELSLAAVNGPALTVVSGPVAAVERLEGRLAEEGLACRRLPGTHAFHSSLMQPLAGPLAALVASIERRPPRIPYLSNVTGTWITAEQAADPAYWAEHLCRTVRFAEGIGQLLADPDRILVEVGPGQSLGSFVRQHPACDRQGTRAVLPTLRYSYDRQPDLRFLLGTLGKLWMAGASIDWPRFSARERRHRVALPTYPFERQRYWFEPFAPRPAAGPPDGGIPDKRADMADWFYVPVWREAPVPASPAPSGERAACWLIFADDQGMGAALVDRLRRLGAAAVEVRPGRGFDRAGEDAYVLAPGSAADHAALLGALRRAQQIPTRIVHLWSLTGKTEAAADELLERSFYSPLFLAQALANQGVGVPVRCAFVSDGLHRVTGREDLRPEKATLLGPTIVVPQELAGVACRSVDVDLPGPEGREELLDVLMAEVLAGRDPVVAYRGGHRFVRAFEPVRLPPADAAGARLRQGGVYLVTGGFGGLGLAVADFLARRTGAKLALIGRSALPQREEWRSWLETHDAADPVSLKILRVLALEELGAEVLPLSGDVADPDAMREAVERTRRRFGGLHGVVHAAGVPGSGLIQLKTAEAAAAVLRPKVAGTLALAAAQGGRPLDFLVLFSSSTASAGGFGQVDYCAANAFLGAFAERQAAGGTAVVTIDWGPWEWDAWEQATAGIPEIQAQHREMRRKLGVTLAEGTEALGRILASGLPHVVVSTADFGAVVAQLERFTAAAALAALQEARRERPRYARPALGVSYVPATGRLERKIAEVWQRALGLDEVGVEDNFFDLGGNSLLGMQVVSDLNRELGAEITPVKLFAAPTVGALARALAPALAEESPRPAVKVRPAAPARSEIAIVGMACRFPQSADLDQYWTLLRDGVEALSHFSDEELAAAGVPAERLANPAYVKVGSVLEGIDSFDAGLFGYTPREAEILDPQQRFFLECAWEALEHAGYDSQRYRGKIGVFAGANLSTYLFNLLSSPSLQGSVNLLQTVLANEKDALTTTASYKLNLRGPSLAVQTFCSTSLVAVHMACRSLQADECELALAGGVRIAVPHRAGYLYEEGGIEPPDGRCRAFDADGKGSVLGNGVGIVVLKRLADALADGDTIHAVIKGSSVNNDGSLKVGYTAPSVEGQAQVVEEALEAAGVDPASIGYVEAHGTGTPLGDPVEIAALSRAFRGRPAAAGRCPIGSVKTNFGHLDRAAGVSGLIKTVLALRHRKIPPSLHFERPNPNIDFAHSPFRVNTALAEWPAGDGPRRAGVNSVGMGGTNAHVILEEAPPAPPAGPSRPWQLLLLSARTATALDAATARLGEHLERHPDLDLADAAYTLQVGRRALSHRRMLVCQSREEAQKALARPAEGRIYTARTEGWQRPIVFMFPGLGDHYTGMAAGLYRDEAVFRRELDRCAEILRPHLGIDLREMLGSAETSARETGSPPGGIDLRKLLRRGKEADTDPRLRQTWIAQPAVFAIEHALAQLLIAWGLRPQAMIGYSLGEYVAACLAGVLSLEDALLLVARRAQMISDLPAGAMLAVALPEAEAAPLAGDELSLAAVNGPALSVWAGPVAAVAELERQLAERGVAASRLQTSHAFHSRMMDPIAGGLRELVHTVELSPPRIPYISNVTGTWITPEEATSPAYWERHLCGAVRFGDGLAELLGEPERILLEVGPGQALVAFARQHPAWDGDARRLALPTLRHEHSGEPDAAFLLGTLGRLWLAGVEVGWEGFYAGESRRRIPLPAYPFERQRYWIAGGDGLRGTAALPARAGKRPDLADWFYLPAWKPSVLPAAPSAGQAPASWLVLVDERGLGRRIVAGLRELGQRVTAVTAGSRFRSLAEGEYVVDPLRPEDFMALLESLDAPPDRIVHLWALTPAASRPSGPELLADLLSLGFYSLLSLGKAIGRRSLTAPLALWVVSDRMQKVHGLEDLRPEAATLLGPCKVLPQEYLNVTCRSVDVVLPTPGSWQEDRLVRQLVAELSAEPADLMVSYRGAERWVQIFEPVRLEGGGQRPPRLRERGVYMITGGLGTIGLTLAERLAERVQARIALLGRSGLPPREAWADWLAAHPEDRGLSRKIRQLQAIEAKGSEVLVLAADVGDEEEMTRAVASVYQRFGALQGVVHAAGITSEEAFVPVQEIGRELCELHFHAKIRGLYTLEKVLRGEPLDFFLLQSSLSSVLGGLGFVAYVAANAFMDAFAHRQNQEGPVPWLSVNWDTWQGGDGGASTFGATVAQFAMSREEGLEALERVLALDAGGQIVSSTGDLGARIAQWIELRSSSRADGARGEAHARPQLANPYEDPASEIERTVAGIWQDVLGIEPVGRRDDFFELGGHSLLATQVFSRLRESFRVELPMRSLFESPTVAGLSGMIETVLWVAKGGEHLPVALAGEREELEL